MYTAITGCRICGDSKLASIFDLGTQALTGVFPRSEREAVGGGPLALVKCARCHLVQLAHNYDLGKLYGDNYGYRSGLNPSMVRHLQSKVRRIEQLVALANGDLVIDIGSNDGTLLSSYAARGAQLVGIDPSGPKFQKYYPPHVRLIPEFFDAALVERQYPGKKAKVVTSIAMFYDLERPRDFVAQVARVLAPDGVWVFEQSYMPAMVAANAYDTICHEHLEYYALAQVESLLREAGLKIVGVEFNDVNGGSFSVAAAHRASPLPEARDAVAKVLEEETALGVQGQAYYDSFVQRVKAHKARLTGLLGRLSGQGRKVFGYGASTKGNVVIQYCGITRREVPCIAEVNEEKFGAFTPGSLIPIVAEREARASRPDYFLVFPWHFRRFIVEKEAPYLAAGGKLIFPLPEVEIVSKGGVERVG